MVPRGCGGGWGVQERQYKTLNLDFTQHRDTWGDLRYIRDLGGVAEHALPASALQQRILTLLSSFGGFGKPGTYLWDLLAEAVPDDLGVAAPQHPVHLVTELRVGLCVRVQTSAEVICLMGGWVVLPQLAEVVLVATFFLSLLANNSLKIMLLDFSTRRKN